MKTFLIALCLSVLVAFSGCGKPSSSGPKETTSSGPKKTSEAYTIGYTYGELHGESDGEYNLSEAKKGLISDPPTPEGGFKPPATGTPEYADYMKGFEHGYNDGYKKSHQSL